MNIPELPFEIWDIIFHSHSFDYFLFDLGRKVWFVNRHHKSVFDQVHEDYLMSEEDDYPYDPSEPDWVNDCPRCGNFQLLCECQGDEQNDNASLYEDDNFL